MTEQTLGLFNYVMLSRIQFGFTAVFHILWPVLTIGLSLFLLIMEALWLTTRNDMYYHHARFWGRIFILNFAIGVATGIPMEFQFGTNWNRFSLAGGDIFGHLLGFEAAMAFMLEASFLGVMVFGWNRVPRWMHLFATAMVTFGSFLSGFWIMVANSWMQTPTGGFMDGGKFVLTSHWDSIFNPDARWGVSHMLVACVEISLFVVGGISAWYMLKKRHTEFFLKSFKVAVIAAILITPLQVFLGDGSGRDVYTYQPAKLAAMEAHWDTNKFGEGAPWNILAWPDQQKQENRWAISIPYFTSLITTRSLTGQVLGMKEFPREDQPPVWYPFYGFRIMIALGFGFFLVMLWTVWSWHRGKLSLERITEQKWLLYIWMLCAPLSYLAMEAGWIVRETGRQPWTMYGLVRTVHSASDLPSTAVGTSLFLFFAVYVVLLAVFLIFVRRIFSAGPNLDMPGRNSS